LENHSRQSSISIGIGRRIFWFELSFPHKISPIVDFPSTLVKDKGGGGQTLMKKEKISSIINSQNTLSESGKIHKDHNKHSDHDKIYSRSSILDVFLESRLFQGSQSEKKFDILIVDPANFSASKS
jgi:hypothetical protein